MKERVGVFMFKRRGCSSHRAFRCKSKRPRLVRHGMQMGRIACKSSFSPCWLGHDVDALLCTPSTDNQPTNQLNLRAGIHARTHASMTPSLPCVFGHLTHLPIQGPVTSVVAFISSAAAAAAQAAVAPLSSPPCHLASASQLITKALTLP